MRVPFEYETAAWRDGVYHWRRLSSPQRDHGRRYRRDACPCRGGL